MTATLLLRDRVTPMRSFPNFAAISKRATASHYTPEDLKDAETKIAYLEDLKTIAAESKNAEDFKAKVSARYPQYSGQNYLDMTAGFFFA